MKVILVQDVKKVGAKGDVLDVAEGYARNFLFPRKLAVEATTGYMKDLEQKKKSEAGKKARIAEEARQLAARLGMLSIKIPTKVGEAGKLFGSITGKDIAEAVKNQHKIEIDRKKIELAAPIKTLGLHPVTVRLHPDVQAVIQVQVVEA